MEQIKKMINTILNSKSYDFNVQNINLDTALSVACEYPSRLWIVKHLIANPNVNVNVINDINCGALGNAIRKRNIAALELLGTRPDLVVREEDEELAKQHNIELAKYINPQPFATHTVEQVVTSENKVEDSLAEQFAKFLKARKG